MLLNGMIAESCEKVVFIKERVLFDLTLLFVCDEYPKERVVDGGFDCRNLYANPAVS